ncbi:hypothetical protein KKE26_07815 [bacterium]|nr:hypothetical protein [bacterium]MBU1753768.1 hypothetical protein [bacterium]
MECRYIQSQLSSFLDSTLIFPAPIKEHLETCSICQDELSSIKRTIEFTSSIEEILPPIDFLSSVHEEIKKEAVPILPEYNLSIIKRYIIYAILLISAGLWLTKVFLFKENMSHVISVDSRYRAGSQTVTNPASPSDSVHLVAKNKISLLVPPLEEKILLSSPIDEIRVNANSVPMEDDIMVFSGPKDVLTPLPLNPQMDITNGSLPKQIPLKPRARVLKLVIDGEPIEKEELLEESTIKELPYTHYELGDFLIRLNDYNEVCSVQLRDVVLVYESAKYANPEELEEKRDSIKDIIQGVVVSYDSKEIKQTENLKRELKERINTMLQEGKILQIGFKIVVE